MWIVGNLAGECSASRDAVICAGVLKPIGWYIFHVTRISTDATSNAFVSDLPIAKTGLGTTFKNWCMGAIEYM